MPDTNGNPAALFCSVWVSMRYADVDRPNFPRLALAEVRKKPTRGPALLRAASLSSRGLRQVLAGAFHEDPSFQRVFLFYKPSLDRLGIATRVRTVDEVSSNGPGPWWTRKVTGTPGLPSPFHSGCGRGSCTDPRKGRFH